MRIFSKPWGKEYIGSHADKHVCKILDVSPGCRLSLQLPEIKHESLLVIEGSGTVRIGDAFYTISTGDVFHVQPKAIHWVDAGKSGLKLIEVSTPELEDVVRLEDDYGRDGGSDKRNA